MKVSLHNGMKIMGMLTASGLLDTQKIPGFE
jgi:hypothetical protein